MGTLEGPEDEVLIKVGPDESHNAHVSFELGPSRGAVLVLEFLAGYQELDHPVALYLGELGVGSGVLEVLLEAGHPAKEIAQGLGPRGREVPDRAAIQAEGMEDSARFPVGFPG